MREGLPELIDVVPQRKGGMGIYRGDMLTGAPWRGGVPMTREACEEAGAERYEPD